MGNIKGPAQFDKELQDAWRDNTKLDSALEILDSLSALDKISPPAGLKQKILEIPTQASWKIFSLSPIRVTSLVLAPALALLFVLVVIPRQRHDQMQAPLTFNHQGMQVDPPELDATVEDLGALSTDIGEDLDLNILDQDIQDLEEVL